MGTYQGIYALAGMALAILAFYTFAGMAVYRVVALVIIGILWSSLAGRMALKKPVDLQETMSVPALLTRKYTDETHAYLKALKQSFLEKK
jgi:hypothetical protein